MYSNVLKCTCKAANDLRPVSRKNSVYHPCRYNSKIPWLATIIKYYSYTIPVIVLLFTKLISNLTTVTMEVLPEARLPWIYIYARHLYIIRCARTPHKSVY